MTFIETNADAAFSVVTDPSVVGWDTKITIYVGAIAGLCVGPTAIAKFAGLKKKIDGAKSTKIAIDNAGVLKKVLNAVVVWVKAKGELVARTPRTKSGSNLICQKVRSSHLKPKDRS